MRNSKVAGLVLGGLLVIGLGLGAIARTNAGSYDTQTAVNIPLPVQYTFALSLTPSSNTQRLPIIKATTGKAQTEYIDLQGMNIVRIDDLSTGTNFSTVNVTMNLYADVIYSKTVTGSYGANTMNMTMHEYRLMSSKRVSMNGNIVITANKYSVADFIVKSISNNAGVRVTLNVLVRSSLKSVPNDARMVQVYIPAGSTLKVSSANHTAIALDNSVAGATTMWLGRNAQTSLNVGWGLPANGALAFDGDFDVWACSVAGGTLNVMETY